jgi:hypothetical protein
MNHHSPIIQLPRRKKNPSTDSKQRRKETPQHFRNLTIDFALHRSILEQQQF